VVNLVENALDAYRQRADGDGQVQIAWRACRGRLELEVRDQAGGIARDRRRRIFDPFFTTKLDGSGVGLSLARQLAREAGGSLRHRPLGRQGSRFRLDLPLAKGNAP
jgi:C4-dicarboxylate-specific signal transduction histidine kinase